ncbi:MAG: anthranilate phosphoribosyltransferase, partial [Elusimicrobiota bacterium]|nr:anthranilate phosphoribosyltransferase [Elusimicrobiota bacterium]
ITLSDATTICEVSDKKLNSFFITPEQFGFKRCALAELIGGTPNENAEIAKSVLSGAKGPKRDIVVLNAAICMYMFYNNKTIRQCIQMACDILDSKKALEKLNEFIKVSNEFSK